MDRSSAYRDALRDGGVVRVAAGVAVGFALVSCVGAVVNTLITELDEQPGRWTFAFASLVTFVVVAALAALALARTPR